MERQKLLMLHRMSRMMIPARLARFESMSIKDYVAIFMIRTFKDLNISFRPMLNRLLVVKWTNRLLQERFVTTIHIYLR